MPSLAISATLQTIARKKPLIHHLTNWVTINDCAQITRHWGCLPVMAHAIEEVEEMVSISSALVLNIGTLTTEFIDAMALAGRKANARGIPVVLDVVGAGATRFRTEQARRLLDEVHIDFLKGNAGEIATMAGVEAEVRGVESISVGEEPAAVARRLASQLHTVVVITGAEDIVSDGQRTWGLAYGHELMGRVVGTGCMSSSTVGCFASVRGKSLGAAAEALAAYGWAGGRAAAKAAGPGDFVPCFFNEITKLAARPGDLMLEAEALS